MTRLSFALSAGKIKEKARVVAMDLRGHGKSTTDNDLDLSIEVLCVKSLYVNFLGITGSPKTCTDSDVLFLDFAPQIIPQSK